MARRSRAGIPGKNSEVRAQAEASLGHLEDCWDEPAPGVSLAPRDGDRLQGAWATATGRRPAVLLVCGARFAIRFADGVIYMGNFELDTRGRPRAMVMRIEEGPAKHKGQTALCFYEFETRRA